MVVPRAAVNSLSWVAELFGRAPFSNTEVVLIEGLPPFVWLAVPAMLVLLIGLRLLLGRGAPLRDGRRPFRLRPARRLIGLLCVATGCATALLAVSLTQFARLTGEKPVAQVSLQQQGERQFTATVTMDGQAPRDYALRGDEWQIDARVVRWELPALLAGAPSLYRLERLSGRYADPVVDEAAPRTVHALAPTRLPDVAALKRRFPGWMPFVDVEFGSAGYMPMFDGARYQVYLDPRGALFIRPADPATKQGMEQLGW